jgi:hypothetical protein
MHCAKKSDRWMEVQIYLRYDELVLWESTLGATVQDEFLTILVNLGPMLLGRSLYFESRCVGAEPSAIAQNSKRQSG